MARLCLSFVFVNAILTFSNSAFSQSALDYCVVKQTCHECIRMSNCAWCAQADFQGRKRCFLFNPKNISSSHCSESEVWSPTTEYYKIEKQAKVIEEFKLESANNNSSSQNDVFSIVPQEVKLKLRINESFNISFNYTQAVSHPVDLYYLMDISQSMVDDKEKLSALGDILIESMKNITPNFKVGFGSFVDKVVMPYVSVVPQKLEEPCDGCVAPYGFKNYMSLSDDTTTFSGEVKNAEMSGNLDGPEGGLDGIMQAVVCRKQIGWRHKARRFLVFTTDAEFHYAGDGKLGGIIKPNDGTCHLNNDGYYTHSTLQDYPSVYQINQKVKQNKINVVFAVTSQQITNYNRLVQHVEGSSAAELSQDSSNIVELIKDQYYKITSNIEMKDTASTGVQVSYYSDCHDTSAGIQKTNKCAVLPDSTVAFTAEIKVKSCPEDKKEWNQTFQIYPVGINESLTVHLEMQCECPCENPDNSEYAGNARQCSGYGTYKCGICECDEFHFGQFCECDAHNSATDSKDGCRPDSSTLIDCSGQGTCYCGRCYCDVRDNPTEVISGNYCECDNFSCDRVDSYLCSGPGKGTCECGECRCEEGWSSPNCSCSTSVESCMRPGSSQICSGRGDCICGKCICDSDTEWHYTGAHCEKCPTCPDKCVELKDCVHCQVHKGGPFNEEECIKNCSFTTTIVESVDANGTDKINLCIFLDENNCRITFAYDYDETGNVDVMANRNKECRTMAATIMTWMMVGVMAFVLLVGLIILILWKVLTIIQDKREFIKFEKEAALFKWHQNENPLYKGAITEFRNPMYKGKND